MTSFHLEIVRPASGYSEYLKLSSGWVILSFVGTVLLSWAAEYKASEYLYSAINQGISAQLWNVISAIGLALFGLSLATLKVESVSRFFSNISAPVLMVAFEMGLLGMGVIIAKVVLGLEESELLPWQVWFHGVSLVMLIAIVFILNSLLWFFARVNHRGERESMLLLRAREANFTWQVVVGIFFIVSPVVYFWLDK